MLKLNTLVNSLGFSVAKLQETLLVKIRRDLRQPIEPTVQPHQIQCGIFAKYTVLTVPFTVNVSLLVLGICQNQK